MNFQLRSHHSSFGKDCLEEGRILTASEDAGRVDACYSRLFARGPRSSWKSFGCCIVLGLINSLSTLFTLAGTTNLRFSDMLIWSNGLLLSTGFVVSLIWRSYSSHHQWEKEQNRAGNQLTSRVKLFLIGNFFTVLLSPAVACLLLSTICWLERGGRVSSYTSGVPLMSCWALVSLVTVPPVSYLSDRRKIHEQSNSSGGYALLQEGIDDCDTYENLDETDGPTFLPQRLPHAYCDIFGGPLTEETKAASTFAMDVSWKNAIEPPEALDELVRWAISVPEESLPPPVAHEVLVMAAITVGACPGGMGCWNQDTQYTYLMSRMCDRLAEIFQRAGPSAVPEHALNVFFLANRFEQFDGVDVAVLGMGNGDVPEEEMRNIVRCLKSRSASLLDC